MFWKLMFTTQKKAFTKLFMYFHKKYSCILKNILCFNNMHTPQKICLYFTKMFRGSKQIRGFKNIHIFETIFMSPKIYSHVHKKVFTHYPKTENINKKCERRKKRKTEKKKKKSINWTAQGGTKVERLKRMIGLRNLMGLVLNLGRPTWGNLKTRPLKISVRSVSPRVCVLLGAALFEWTPWRRAISSSPPPAGKWNRAAAEAGIKRWAADSSSSP